jgi:hypothetical protein
MTADRGSQSRNPFNQLQARPVVGAIVTDVDDGLDPGARGILQGLLRSQRLAQVQEVRVRIDQATGSGFSIRGNRTPPGAVWVRGASRPHSRAVAQGAFRSAFTCAAILTALSGRKGEIK